MKCFFTAIDVRTRFAFALFGIGIVAGGFERYLLFLGRVPFWTSPLFFISGMLIAFPEWWTTAAGLATTAALVVIVLLFYKNRHVKETVRLT